MQYLVGIFLAAALHAQILAPVMFGIDPDVKTPVDSPGAGSYGSTQSVTITDASANFIRYTTDGSTPSFTAGTLYSGAFNISVTTTLKAIGCKIQNQKCGGVLTSVYTISGASQSLLHATDCGAHVSGTACTVTALSSGSLVVALVDDNGAMSALSFSATGASFSVTNCNVNNQVKCGYAFNVTAGATSVNLTWTGGGDTRMQVLEFSNTPSLSVLDKQSNQTQGGGANTTYSSTATATTTGTNDLCVGAVTNVSSNSTTATPTTGMTQAFDINDSFNGYRFTGFYSTLNAAAAYTNAGNFSSGSSYGANILCFK